MPHIQVVKVLGNPKSAFCAFNITNLLISYQNRLCGNSVGTSYALVNGH